MLGGRAAEEVVYGDLTTGAESDLEQATRIARQMVGRWGMSEQIGLVAVLPGPNDEPTLFPGGNDGISERTRQMVDDEVRRIIEEAHRDAARDARRAPRPARGARAGAARARDARRDRRLPDRRHRAATRCPMPEPLRWCASDPPGMGWSPTARAVPGGLICGRVGAPEAVRLLRVETSPPRAA